MVKITSFVPFIVVFVLAVSGRVQAQTPTDSGEVFTFVEQMPQFPGGDKALEKFHKENLKEPKVAKANRKQGRVVAYFIVGTDGTLQEITILKPLAPEYDEEVLRFLKSMPPWIPGKQNGITVRVRYMFPVDFK